VKNIKYYFNVIITKLKKIITNLKNITIFKKIKIPDIKQFRYSFKVFNKKEKTFIKILMGIIFCSFLVLGFNLITAYTYKTPTPGGEYKEASIGNPKLINPLFNHTNPIDEDISKLVFNGLLSYDENNNLQPRLAEKYVISNDGLKYTFYLKKNIFWHDKHKFTADDVLATVGYIKNAEIKTPLYINLTGVDVEKIDNYTVTFNLEKPFAPLTSILTFGILPKHIWDNVRPENMRLIEANIKPIGTGAWKFKKLTKNKKGFIKSYTLVKNKDFFGQKPFLDKITFKFYKTFDQCIKAFNSKAVHSISYLPNRLKDQIKIKNSHLNYLQLPQYSAIFFNQENNQILKDKEIRKALLLSLDREKIKEKSIGKYGNVIDTPFFKAHTGYFKNIKYPPKNIKQAKELINKKDWQTTTVEQYKNKYLTANKETVKNDSDSNNKNSGKPKTILTEQEINKMKNIKMKNNKIITIRLTTLNKPQLIKAANSIKNAWQDLGIAVILEIYDYKNINEIIKQRNYEALIYNENLGHDPDPYPFWHSSQINFPGLNLAKYNDKKIDKLIIEARQTINIKKRASLYKDFQETIINELPAIFLFQHYYLYIQSPIIKIPNVPAVISASDRFKNSYQWYIKEKRKIK
jgi:peptide/nickel transport system substrate-binding protein